MVSADQNGTIEVVVFTIGLYCAAKVRIDRANELTDTSRSGHDVFTTTHPHATQPKEAHSGLMVVFSAGEVSLPARQQVMIIDRFQS